LQFHIDFAREIAFWATQDNILSVLSGNNEYFTGIEERWTEIKNESGTNAPL